MIRSFGTTPIYAARAAPAAAPAGGGAGAAATTSYRHTVPDPRVPSAGAADPPAPVADYATLLDGHFLTPAA